MLLTIGTRSHLHNAKRTQQFPKNNIYSELLSEVDQIISLVLYIHVRDGHFNNSKNSQNRGLQASTTKTHKLQKKNMNRQTKLNRKILNLICSKNLESSPKAQKYCFHETLVKTI